MQDALLEVSNLNKRFGGLQALSDVTFSCRNGEILGLIGPNGAGKTTLFNVIAGVYKPMSGKIKFRGKDITGTRSYKICKLGISRTYQIPRFFKRLTTLDNVALAAIYGKGLSLNNARNEASKLLDKFLLGEKKNVTPDNLTLLELKLLELAKATSSSPSLLLLDEVMSGLSAKESAKVVTVIEELRKEKVTIIWVEHVLSDLFKICDRVIVLNEGKILAEGKPQEIVKNSKVIEAYLGEEFAIS